MPARGTAEPVRREEVVLGRGGDRRRDPGGHSSWRRTHDERFEPEPVSLLTVKPW
jgi:hypothetical protein